MIGAPGSDSYDPTGCAAPPYHMKLALSAIASAGSPNHVPGGCNGTTFTQGGGDPSIPCHFDQSTSGFSATTVSAAIVAARNSVLGAAALLDPIAVAADPRTTFLATPLPNPARERTRIHFGLPTSSNWSLNVHDVAGRLVRALGAGRADAGEYSLEWNLSDDVGRRVPDGIYFVRLTTGAATRSSRAIVQR